MSTPALARFAEGTSAVVAIGWALRRTTPASGRIILCAGSVFVFCVLARDVLPGQAIFIRALQTLCIACLPIAVVLKYRELRRR